MQWYQTIVVKIRLAAAGHHLLEICIFDFGHFFQLAPSGTTSKMSFSYTRELNFCFFHGFGNLVTQTRFLIIYMVFIGIPAPLPITFAEVVLSSWNDFSFEKIAFRVDESSIFIINHLRPASEGQNHFQCSGTKQLW